MECSKRKSRSNRSTLKERPFFFDLRVKCSNCPVMANCKPNREQLMALINPMSPSFVSELTVKFNVAPKMNNFTYVFFCQMVLKGPFCVQISIRRFFIEPPIFRKKGVNLRGKWTFPPLKRCFPRNHRTLHGDVLFT